MEILSLPAEETAVRRYVEELWLPYHRELGAIVDDHALADDVDLVAEEVEFRLMQLGETGSRTWIAVDGSSDGEVDLAGAGELAGFVTTDLDEPPSVFDGPVRLTVEDIYVREPYRRTGLARDLIGRAVDRAREEECPELVLDVDADNERAIAFYEKLGFQTRRRQMIAPVDDI